MLIHAYVTSWGRDMQCSLLAMIDFISLILQRMIRYRTCMRTWRTSGQCKVQNFYSYPVTCANDLGIINWGRLRRSVFPTKSLNVWLNCQKMSHKNTFPSLSGFFIYSFLSQHKSTVGTRLNQCTANQRLDRRGVKDYCFDNLVKYNISAFLEHYVLYLFWHPSCRIAGVLRFP